MSNTRSIRRVRTNSGKRQRLQNPRRSLKRWVDAARADTGHKSYPPWGEPPADLEGKVDQILWLNSAIKARQLAGIRSQEAPPLELTKQVYDYFLEDQRKLRERTPNVAPPAYEGSPITSGGF